MPPMTIEQAMHLAVQNHQAGRLPEAEAIYRQVLAQDANHAHALHLLGVIAHQVGRHEAATDLIQRAIAVAPAVPDFHNNLGEAFRALGRTDEAIACYQRAIALEGRYLEAHINLANALLERGRVDEAIAACRNALRWVGESPAIHNNLGYGLMQKGALDEAIAALRRAIDLRGDFPAAWVNLGNALSEKGDVVGAIAAYRRAIQIKPDSPDAYTNLGSALKDLGNPEEAIALHREAIRLRPDYAGAYNNLGLALQDLGLLAEARNAWRKAIELKPDFAEPHANLSLFLLLKGELAEGWAEYEWRLRTRTAAPFQARLPQPRWDGSDPRGRTILVHAEQGAGDTIQFIRYASLLAELGARVIVACPVELKPLVRTVAGVREVVSGTEALPAFDVHVPLLSLPLAFKTTMETIPDRVPYLAADPSRVAEWRERLVQYGEGLRVGLAWGGNPANTEDRNRSILLAALAPLAEVKDVVYYSLQKGKAAGQAKNPPVGMTLADLTEELKDFGDTAALMANLDLIITVETVVAHLAGALARPVWTLLPFVPAWRWLLDREDSPWYPTMRLFRQKRRGDWTTVVERVAGELNRRVQGSGFRVQ